MTSLGSSNYFEYEVAFEGILSSHPTQNPEFYNWNRVKIRYCDGASFAGNPEAEFKNETLLFFRGQLIWEAIMDELLSMGMSHAIQAILTGCSAGGLATLRIHCDYFRDHLSEDASIKCVSDGGYFSISTFLHFRPDILGNSTMRSFYHDVGRLQCMFPQEFLKNIRTPVFINPAYGYWQIRNVLVPAYTDPDQRWENCVLDLQNCNAAQMKVLHGFRNSLMDAIGEFRQKKDGGMFINSCYSHCQTFTKELRHSPTSTIAESVGDWYFNRTPVKLVDCLYPCNTSC
ncbi:hypothetical protein Bca101_019816 [Brassica carinata]